MTGLAEALVPLGSTWHDWGHGGAGWWIVAVVLFWGLLVGGILLLLRGSGHWSRRSRPSERESALEVLERRFAEGQVSVEEYQNRRRILDPRADGD
ncbi:MAG: SHOCT domain-containing protein [Solirubrobacteraceae bacterium]